MLIEELITKLKEIKDRYGNLEAILWTQRDAWSYDEHDIAEVSLDEDPDEVRIVVIRGEDKTEGKE